MAAEIDTRPLLPAQLDYFTKDNTHAKPAAFFNPHFFNSPATAEEEIKVGIAIDVGGSMLSWASFHKVNGRLIQSAETVFEPSQEGGRNYLQLLEELRERIGSLAVGISTTGSVMETVLDRTNNLPGFFMDLKTKYNGDFAQVFPRSSRLAVMNDAVAGAMGTLHDLVTLRKLSPEVKNAIYLINGSGINAAIWDQDTIWSTELGGIKIHPQLAEELELDETDTLQVRPIAAGRGIEARWKNKTGQGLSGEQIAELYRDEHPLATRLIDDSVFVATHAVIGLDRNFKLSEKGKSSLIIGHGGVFNVPGYRERLEQRLTEYFGSPTQIIIIGNHQDNPGLKGAALVVLS